MQVDQIIDAYRIEKKYLRDSVARLCEFTVDKDPAVARAGLHALFPNLIERLNDSFDPELCSLYDRVFSQVIDFYRRQPGGNALDEGLKSFGLNTEADLLARKSQLSNLKFQISNPGKILLLSRVTIGADVAVGSVILAKLREAFPRAEFVLLGSRKLRDLFGGDPRLRVREIAYERGGSVLSRLSSWLDLVKIVEDELTEQTLLIDPDSRLTQLGLLPLIKGDRNYFFFESRSYWRSGAERLGELASHWVNEVFELEGRDFPFVALPPDLKNLGREIVEKMRRPVISVNLGVGGNVNKRLSDSFEEELIGDLVKDSRLILDKGATPEERAQIDRITAKLREQGKVIVEADDGNVADLLKQEVIRADVLTWDGGIGSLAALIASSDEYIGYDSAGQHIAAALGIPTLTIFVNSNNRTFGERWRPYGSGVIKVLNLEASQSPFKTDEVLSQVLTLHSQMS